MLTELMLTFSAFLQKGNVGKATMNGDSITQYVAREKFGHITQEPGRMISTMIQTQHQVWLS